MKRLSKLLAAALALCLVLSLCGCAGGGDSVVGSWRYTLDFQKALNAAGDSEDLAALGAMGESFAAAFEGLTMTMILDLKEDNTFALTFDEASVRSAAEGMISKMGEIVPAILSELFGVSEEELTAMYEEAGVSMDEVLEQIVGEMDTEEMVKGILENAVKGTYRYAEGKLYLTREGETENAAQYLQVELKGNELTVVDAVGDEAFEGYKALLPMVFKK